MPDVAADIFREYDIRGVVGEQLTPMVAEQVGAALATHLRALTDRIPRIAVGRDNRPSGEILAEGVRRGIAGAGGSAIDVGILPTPALYFATHTLEVDGGVQVTGSHNPPEFNGFKMVAQGRAVYGATIQEFRKRIVDGSLAEGTGSIGHDDSVLAAYIDAIVSRHAPLARSFKVVVDCGNGVASLAAVQVIERLGLEVEALYCESDGTFPNHHPDPSVLENIADLRARVVETGAEIGVAFDGDGDRIGVVDEQGRVVFGDHILILLARDLRSRSDAAEPVVFDVKCSQVLHDELERIGLTPVMWKTGHSLIKEKMKELGAPLAGEMSGHMFFGGDYFGFDDALFAAARLLTFLAREGGPVSRHLSTLPPTVTTPEIRIECPDDRKFAIVADASRYFGARYPISTLDGVRITYEDGWGLLRASNTQPVLVMRFEASNETTLASARSEVETWLAAQGVR